MRPVLGLVVAMLILPMAVSAQSFDPGLITPEYGPLYQLDIMFDNLKILLSQDKQSAILSVLNERVAEIELSNGSMVALIDYQMKIKELERHITVSTKSPGLDIEVYLAQHEQILSKVEQKVTEIAKPVIDSVINETEKIAKEDVRKTEVTAENNLVKVKSTGSEITVPSEVKVGQNATIHVKIYNPLNEPIKPVIYIESKKEGIVGWVAKKNYIYKLPITIEPGQTYEKNFSVTIPESFMGIPLEGKWEIKVKVIGNGHTLISEEIKIYVTK